MVYKKVSKKAFAIMIINALITNAILLPVIAIAFIIMSVAIGSQMLIIGIITILFILISSFLVIGFRYNFYGYINDENFIRVRSGFFWRSTRTYPINSMQQVDYKQNFIEKMFNVVRISFVLTGSEGDIRYLEEEEAKTIIEYLNSKRKKNV